MIDIEFEKVVPSEEQIQLLFHLLNSRVHRISHQDSVQYEAHRAFVSSHPYREWLLLKVKGEAIGSVYITNENTIGINIMNPEDESAIGKIISYVKNNYTPLKAIPSVRSAQFSVNVPPSNKPLMNSLENQGAKLAQLTFYLPE